MAGRGSDSSKRQLVTKTLDIWQQIIVTYNSTHCTYIVLLYKANTVHLAQHCRTKIALHSLIEENIYQNIYVCIFCSSPGECFYSCLSKYFFYRIKQGILSALIQLYGIIYNSIRSWRTGCSVVQEKLEVLHTAVSEGNLKQVQALAKKKLVAAKVL